MSGRNEPCPCGSGKKYKKCCLAQHEAATTTTVVDFAWKELRRLEGRVFDDHLLPYFFERLSDAYVARAVEDLFPEDLHPDFKAEQVSVFENACLPWAVFNWTARIDLGHPAFDRTKTVAENYLCLHGDRLSSRERLFFDAMLASYYSFYRVLGVELDRSVLVKDTVLGTQHLIKEKQGTHCLNKGDTILARIVTLNDQTVFVGLMPYPIPIRERQEITDFSEWVSETHKGRLTGEVLKTDFEHELFALYFELINRHFSPPMPTLVNTDGDLIQPTQSYFELKMPIEEAVRKLAPIAEPVYEDADDLLQEAILNEEGEILEINIAWSKAGNAKHSSWDNTNLGHVKIDNQGSLVLDTNSAERDEQGKALLKQHLGESITFVRSVIESQDKMLERARATPKSSTDVSQQALLDEHPEIKAHLDKMFKDHWNDWLDETLPALSYQTPRQASQSERGRAMLEELLLDFDVSNARQPNESLRVNVDDLRKKLGLEVYALE